MLKDSKKPLGTLAPKAKAKAKAKAKIRARKPHKAKTTEKTAPPKTKKPRKNKSAKRVKPTDTGDETTREPTTAKKPRMRRENDCLEKPMIRSACLFWNRIYWFAIYIHLCHVQLRNKNLCIFISEDAMPVFLMHWHALWGFLKHVEFLHVLCDNTFAVPHLKFDWSAPEHRVVA